MSVTQNYAPKKVFGGWNGIPFIGYMSGTFIKASNADDAFKMDVGAHGDVTVVQSHNATGNVVVTLQMASPINDLLSAKLVIAKRTGLVFGVTSGPLLLKYNNGTTLIDAPVAWIRKAADVEYGTDGSGREWTFDCAALQMFVGGHLL